MKILEINGGVFGSTGKIMLGIADYARGLGHEVLCASPVTTTNRHREPSAPYVKIGSYRLRQASVLLSRLTGLEGSFAYPETKKLLRTIDRFNPDVIHLHNLHHSYINLPLLFRYIKTRGIKTVWTLHDCWAFTGHCPYFTMAKCDKWKTGCHHCPQYREYPKSLIDNSRYMYRLKKKWFTDVPNLTIVTPSHWLAGLVKESFLKDYPVKVIHNGIDLSVFKPTESDFRTRYGCEDKFILLGVAFDWGKRKGLDVFIELAKRLDDRFRIVLVGTNDKIDRELPPSIISIHRTQNQNELAEIYSAADLFVNPTREDNYPTVNMESIACGTPVVTFRTGGSPEMLNDTCGSVVDCDDLDGLAKIIMECLLFFKPDTYMCKAQVEKYSEIIRLEEYFDLFENKKRNSL